MCLSITHSHKCKQKPKQKVVVISCTKVQFKTGGSLTVGIQGGNSAVSTAIVTLCFVSPVLGLPILRAVCEGSVMITMGESKEVT